jgi:carboxypeptidase PM20D1
MDVVEALAEDWERPPFKLTQDDRTFTPAALSTTSSVWPSSRAPSCACREGFVPGRDLILAFSGDEESGMTTTRMMAYEMPELVPRPSSP